MQQVSPLSVQGWLYGVFNSKAAQDGQIIRRKTRDIERFCGKDVFLAEIKRRGYRAYENSGQVIVFCNAAPIKRLV